MSQSTKAELEALRDKHQAHRTAIADMLKSDGWKLYSFNLQAQKDKLFRDLVTCVDSSTILRTAGALAQLDGNLNWPETQIKAFDVYITQLNKQIKERM